MSFAGHALDMIKRNNQNQALREKHREHFKNKASKSLLNRRTIYPKVAAEKLEGIKKEIRSKAKMERLKLNAKAIALSILYILIAILFIYKGIPIIIAFFKSIS